MSDPILLAMLVQRAAVSHLALTTEADGQQLEAYPAIPDIAALPCMLVTSGKAFQESAVGAMVESDAVMYTEEADLRETDLVVVANVSYRVHAGPSKFFNPWDPAPAAAGTAHVMESGLRKWQP